ncbi:Ferredoxin, 2Fe-2S [Burkholderia vietnamiensis]|nr:Ferredoxin, 2Fe-2S [Burkholderia vietnamiensis]
MTAAARHVVTRWLPPFSLLSLSSREYLTMTILTVLPSGKSYDVAVGATLLQALLGVGEAIAHKCDGKAECGSCHLFVQEGRKSLSKIQRTENEKLDAIVGVGSKSRLACQAVLGDEPVTVELLSFV